MTDICQGAVQFFGPYDRARSARLKFRNATTKPIIFRLKCNKPLDFNIEPSGVGVLSPDDTRPLTLIALPELDRDDDCILIFEYAAVADSPNQNRIDPVTAWTNVKTENLSKTAIRALFGRDARSDEESETTVIVINESTIVETEPSVGQVIWRLRSRDPDSWWLLQTALLILALISFLCGLWVGSRKTNRANY